MSKKLDVRPVKHDVVSVVVVAGGDVPAALDCVERLEAVDWPHDLVESVVVGPADALRDGAAGRGLDIRVVDAPADLSVAAARNLGLEAVQGTWTAFIDRDARPDPHWLRAAVRALRADSNIAVAASKVLESDGTIAYVDAAMTFAGEPLLPHAGKPDSGSFDREHAVLFPSPWAMVADTKALRWIEGFDVDDCDGVEHADLGWRLWLAGLSVEAVPESVVHLAPRERTASRGVPSGAAAMLYKNLDDTNLGVALSASLMLSAREPDAAQSRLAALPRLVDARARTQALRRVADLEILPLFRTPTAAGSADERQATEVRSALGVDRIFATRRRVLVATPDVLQPKMAGPGIRALQMAVELARQHDVELVSTVGCELTHPAFPISRVTDHDLHAAVDRADVIIIQGHLIEHHPWIRGIDKIMIVDIYDPFHLEVLEQSRDMGPSQRRVTTRLAIETLNEQLTRGDFFLCASEKQRDFWLGQLAAIGRINPATYDHDENLASLIAVAPFGIEEQPPVATKPMLRGVVPGIGKDDKIILWGGGVYNWFDPLTLILAVDKLRARVPNVRVYFMGMDHPNPRVPAMQMAFRTKELAEKLGLVESHVFFNSGWVDYDERQNFLLEADVGVSTHLDHVETAFSFRTRILDYLWASLPVVASAGDSFGDLIEKHGLGLVVPPNDVDALEEALYTMLTDDARREACKEAIAKIVPRFYWTKALEPLLEFCQHPHRAADLADPRQRVMLGDPIAQAMWGRAGWKHTLAVASGHIKRREWDDLTRKFRMRLRRWLDPSTAGPGGRTDTF